MAPHESTRLMLMEQRLIRRLDAGGASAVSCHDGLDCGVQVRSDIGVTRMQEPDDVEEI